MEKVSFQELNINTSEGEETPHIILPPQPRSPGPIFKKWEEQGAERQQRAQSHMAGRQTCYSDRCLLIEGMLRKHQSPTWKGALAWATGWGSTQSLPQPAGPRPQHCLLVSRHFVFLKITEDPKELSFIMHPLFVNKMVLCGKYLPIWKRISEKSGIILDFCQSLYCLAE